MKMFGVLTCIMKQFEVKEDLKNSPIVINTNRRKLAELFDYLGYTTGAEIGVQRGKFSQTLLQACRDLTLYSVDAWALYPGYRERFTQDLVDNMEAEALARLCKFGSRSQIIKRFSLDAVKNFQDESLDFVYVDANHSFDFVAPDLIEWTKKVRSGGIVAGHDYVRPVNTREIIDVVDVVNCYTKCHKIKPWFVIDGEGKENASYFWVKE